MLSKVWSAARNGAGADPVWTNPPPLGNTALESLPPISQLEYSDARRGRTSAWQKACGLQGSKGNQRFCRPGALTGHLLQPTEINGFHRTTAIALIGLCLATGALAGEWTSRMKLSLDRVRQGGPPSYSEDFILADAVPQAGRRFTEFSGDVSGRFLGAMAEVEQYTGQVFPELDRVAGKLIKLQKADGHFGAPFSTPEVRTSDMALMWGNGRLLIGLLEYYRVNPKPEVLACARRLGDCMVALGPRFNTPAVMDKFSGDQVATGYICWTQIIEGLVALNGATADPRYLRLAEAVAANTHRYPNQHSHGFVSSLRGILELYRVTHDAKWLAKTEAEWDGIRTSGNLLPEGGLPEIFRPGMERDEGCAEADWLRWNLELWTETHNPRYLDQAELTLFNEFALNQCQNGDFGHHQLTGTGIGNFSAHAWWCCTFHGLRAFPDVFKAAFHAGPAGLYYDLPVEGQGTVEGLTVEANSTLEQNATVTLTVIQSAGRQLTLCLRQPAWASALEVSLNQHPLAGTTTNDYLQLHRTWQRGDTLTVHYPLLTRLVPLPQDKAHVGIRCGPWILGVDQQHDPRFFDEPFEQNQLLLPAETGNQELKLKTVAEASTVAPRSVPVAHRQLRYLPGGYPMEPQTVTLRPIAEATSLADGAAWVFWFEPRLGSEPSPLSAQN